MSAFSHRQNLAHPEWLEEFFKTFESQTALIKNKRMPEVLWFAFITTLACRMLRISFHSRWSAAWHVLKWAARGTWEDLHGICFRFWRYRVCMRSADRDFREMISYRCLECAELHPFNEIADDRFKCEGCGFECDFYGICEMTPGDEDEN